MKALLFQGLGRSFIENQGALVPAPELLFVSGPLVFLHQWTQFLTGGDILYQHSHFCKLAFDRFQCGGSFGAGGGDLGYPAFQIRVAFDFMLGQEVQRPGSLFQVVELCPLLIPCGLLGLDAVLQINPQRNFAVFFGLPLRKPPFDALGDSFFGVGFAQRFAASEPPLSGRTERNILAPLDFIDGVNGIDFSDPAKLENYQQNFFSGVFGIDSAYLEEINKTLNLPIDTSAFEQGKVVLLSKTVEDLIQPGQEITIQTQNGQHSFIVANGYLNEGFRAGGGNERGTAPDLYISQTALKELFPQYRVFRVAFDTDGQHDESILQELKQITASQANIDIISRYRRSTEQLQVAGRILYRTYKK